MKESCELCGKRPPSRKARIEGAVLHVCIVCYNSMEKEPMVEKKKGRGGWKPRPMPRKMKLEDVVENYGKIIREAREKAGLSEEEVAKKLGIKRALLVNIEKEKIKPSITLAKKMEKLFHITLIEEVVIETEEVDEEGEVDATFSLLDVEIERD